MFEFSEENDVPQLQVVLKFARKGIGAPLEDTGISCLKEANIPITFG